VVDSGWAGTTQDVLAHVLDVDRVTGVYLGVSDLGRPSSARSAKVGVLRDDARTRPWMNALDRTAGVIRLWDTVLREPHASVSGLERDEGVVRPVLDSATEPTEEQRLLTDALVRGTVEGLRSLRPGFAWLDANPSLDVDAVGAFACACSRALAVSPERDVARALLALRYEEADGSTWSLGWDAIRDRRAWYPGLLSGAGLRPAARLLERAGRVATRRRRR
jgi:hypothetical protein